MTKSEIAPIRMRSSAALRSSRARLWIPGLDGCTQQAEGDDCVERDRRQPLVAYRVPGGKMQRDHGKRTIDDVTREREAYRSRSPANGSFSSSSAWNLLD
jgi:hypothetical protein